MRNVPNLKANRYRVRHGLMGSDDTFGNCGSFRIPQKGGPDLVCVVSDGTDAVSEGWEHVSVSTACRTPTWEEMCLVKRLFWRDDETVVQFHPPDRDYLNVHPNVLHLWRRPGAEVELPPPELVGVTCPGFPNLPPAGKGEAELL